MSRVGRNPVPIPAAAKIKIDGETVTVKGPKGSLTRTFPNVVEISHSNGSVVVKRKSDAIWHRGH